MCDMRAVLQTRAISAFAEHAKTHARTHAKTSIEVIKSCCDTASIASGAASVSHRLLSISSMR
jgi:hypothetical protein